MKSKTPLHSRPETLTHDLCQLGQEYSIHGISAVEIIVMVRYHYMLHIFTNSFIAALAMYQRARKIQDLIHDPQMFSSLVEEQLEAYSVAVNALSLVDPQNAWILLPITPESVHEVGDYLVCVLYC